MTSANAANPSDSAAQVAAATTRISSFIRRTPVLTTKVANDVGENIPVAFKLEYLQHGGSFKIRGSLNAILRAREDDRLTAAGIVIASGGNAAIGAALAGQMLDVAVTVVVPETAPEVKVSRLRALGASIHQVGDRYSIAAQAADELAEASGATKLHAYDHLDIVAGAGTLMTELHQQLAGPLDIAVCVGGGGLFAGICWGTKKNDQIIGVEPVGASTMHQAITAGRPVDVALDSIASDSLGATRIGTICWNALHDNDVVSTVVNDHEIAAARRALWEQWRIVVEYGTASALAPVISGVLRPRPGHTLVVLLCGANTAIDDLM